MRSPVPEVEPVAAPPMPATLVPIATAVPIELPGTITGLSAPVLAAGSEGRGNPGSGTGPGTGTGAGPGSGGNTGGGEYVPGGNVTMPELIFERPPTYTVEAVRARIEGVVEIEAVVRADGSVARPRIVHSLDPRHGLDQQAVKAVMTWRFKPARLRDTNEPVDVLVRFQLAFVLR